ncbi:MAG: hypothetical protein JW769_02295 [Parachlamydiales bacterium]|nr:hypothetical protein [Parachlamydiales bacterium]
MNLFRSLLFLFITYGALNASASSLYNRLDPTSVRQHLALYELFPNTPEGQKALHHAWALLQKEDAQQTFSIPNIDLPSFIALIGGNLSSTLELHEKDCLFVNNLAKHLANRTLKTHGCSNLEEILQASPEEIDLGRALLLAVWGEDPKICVKINSYEAMLDLMALQIQAHLPSSATAFDKINAINNFLFFELGFRFPSYSLYAKNVDLFSFLPSVIDSRKGVCLGISVLYLSLAQRLDLPLEAITPPGHIFVRYISPKKEVRNIETTARGIHLETEQYLSVETPSLIQRNYKEVIGLVFMNMASNAWMHKEYPKAIALYKKALLYLPDDPLLQKFLAYNYLFAGKVKKGQKILQKIANIISPDSIVKDSIPEDFLQNKTSIEAIKTIYLETDETRDSILNKQKKLLSITKKHPQFRAGLFHLALTYLQIGREKEATKYLDQFFQLDAQEPMVNYYLTILHMNRFNYPDAWRHFLLLEKELQKIGYVPDKLKDLSLALRQLSPPPSVTVQAR